MQTEDEEEEGKGGGGGSDGLASPAVWNRVTHLKYSVATSGQSHLGGVRMNQRLTKCRHVRCVYCLNYLNHRGLKISYLVA